MAFDFGVKSVKDAPKLQYPALGDWMEGRKKKEEMMNPGVTQARNFFLDQAQGRNDVGTQAIVDANREAMARQAMNVRNTAAAFAAKNVGQGDAVKATQQAELGILGSMGDSRNKELQALSGARVAANERLLDEAKSGRGDALQAIQAGMQYGSPAVKKASMDALAGWAESQGIAMPTQESRSALDQFFLEQAENDPNAMIERTTKELAAGKLLRDKLFQSGASYGDSIVKVFEGTGKDVAQAKNVFIDSLNPIHKSQGEKFFAETLSPMLASGRTAEASKAANDFFARLTGQSPKTDAQRVAEGLNRAGGLINPLGLF